MFALYWMAAAVILLIIEILTLGLTSIWFAGGAVLAAAAAFIGAPLWLQMVLFIVVSCVLFFMTRPLAQKYLNSHVEKTNVDAIIGQHGIVKEEIDNAEGKGLVIVNGVDWSAKSLNGEVIREGSQIVIHKIQGVKLVVESMPMPAPEPWPEEAKETGEAAEEQELEKEQEEAEEEQEENQEE